jgi:hypothetical protein
MRPDRGPEALVGALAFAVFVLYALEDAGYRAAVWYLGAIFLVLLLAVWLWTHPGVLARLPGTMKASVAFLGLLTAWTYVSIAWSDVKGDAWDGANRGLLYLVVYVLFLTLALRTRDSALLFGAYALAVAGLGLGELVAASRSADPGSFFLLARFAEPTGYQNANCALFSLAFWPAVVLAARRPVPLVARGLLFAAAGMLVELALLSQSRGWLAAMPVVAVLYVALVPGRVRSLVFLMPLAAALLLTRGPLLDVFPALQQGRDVDGALHSAVTAIVVSGVVLLLVGAGLAYVDKHLWPRGVTAQRLARGAAVAFGLLAVVALVGGLVWLGNPVSRLDSAWDEFKGKPPSQPTASYLTAGFGSNRYDIWRVAVDEVAGSPLQGVGSDNFAVDYLRERRSDEEPLYPHSLELKILAQTGVVGALLFAGFLVTAVAGWWRRRDESELARYVRAAAFVGFAYWFVHGSLDWFWELAGLAAPAFAMLGIAVGGADPVADPRPRGRGVLAIGAAVLVVALCTLVPPWLAAKEVEAAAGEWRDSPARAFARLDRARTLNPLSDWPDVIAGAIASRRGETERMTASFRRALARNPTNWYSHLELAVTYARTDRRALAFRELREVSRLNPREPTVALVRKRIRSGRPISTAELDRIFLRRTLVSNRERPE